MASPHFHQTLLFRGVPGLSESDKLALTQAAAELCSRKQASPQDEAGVIQDIQVHLKAPPDLKEYVLTNMRLLFLDAEMKRQGAPNAALQSEYDRLLQRYSDLHLILGFDINLSSV